MTEEQRERLLAKLARLTGAEPSALAFVLDAAADKALNYCNREDVPPRMENLLVELAAEAWRLEARGAEAESIRVGDATVTLRDDKYNEQTGAGGADFLKNHRAQLNRFARMGTAK